MRLLFRWRFVIHGGVDGFSRVIVFMNICDNNRADTVLTAFEEGVAEWGLPSRVRYFGKTFFVWPHQKFIYFQFFKSSNL